MDYEAYLALFRILAGITVVLVLSFAFNYVKLWRDNRAHGKRGPPSLCISKAALQGQLGMSLQKVIVAILVAFIGVIFIVNITPTMETTITTANITNTFTSSMIDMFKWLIPVGGLVGIAYGIFRLFGGGGGGKKGE